MVGGSIVIIVTNILVVILHLILIQKLGHIYVINVNMPKIIHNLFHFYIFISIANRGTQLTHHQLVGEQFHEGAGLDPRTHGTS